MKRKYKTKKKRTSKKRVKSKHKTIKPLRSNKNQINRSLKYSKYFIRHSVASNVREYLSKLLKDVKRGNDSKKRYTIAGKYTPSRQIIHNRIILHFLKQDRSSNNPKVYVFGGNTASGKTTALKKYVKGRAINVNNDDIKLRLAKYDKSPFKQYPLIHASYLHEESSDIEKELIEQILKRKKDIILDRTLASYQKNKKLLLRMRNHGYKIKVLGTNLPTHIAIIRASTRFFRQGRYVPLNLIAEKGNKINSNVLRMARQPFVSKAKVYDTRKHKKRIMYNRGF